MKKKEECKKHDKESECGDCGKMFYLIPKEEECNCQYEQGHSLACPLYKKPKNPLESSDFTTKKMDLKEEFFKKFGYSVKSSRAITTGFSNEIADWWLEKIDQALQAERQRIVEIIEEARKLPPSSRNLILDDIINLILQDNK